MADKVENIINLKDNLHDTWEWSQYGDEQDANGNGESKLGDEVEVNVNHVIDMKIFNDEVKVNEVHLLI